MNVLSRLKFRTKLVLLLGLSTLALVASIGVAASLMHQRMLADRVDKLRGITETALGLAQSLEDQVTAHKLTREQAIALFRDAAHKIRFDAGAGYIVAQTLTDMIVVHGTNPGLEGKPSTAKTADGKALTPMIAEALRNANEGVVSYHFVKPGNPQPQPKVGLVSRFTPWDIVFNIGSYVDDIDAEFASILQKLAMIAGGILLMTLLAAGLISRDITRSLSGLRAAMERLAKGDLSTEIPGAERRDEVGGMAATVGVFKQNMTEAERLRGEQEVIKAQAAAERKAALHQMAESFESKVGGLVGMLSSSSTALESTAQSMTGTANEGNRQATAVASAAEEASSGLQSVSSAAEELSSSIGEISRQVAQSSTITSRAVDDAKRTDVIVRALAEGAEKIGAVVGLITNIASQTTPSRAERHQSRRRGPAMPGGASRWWPPR